MSTQGMPLRKPAMPTTTSSLIAHPTFAQRAVHLARLWLRLEIWPQSLA
jgi:hypothetical protein